MKLMHVGKIVLQTLSHHGYEAYFVGGMVRDTLLDYPIYDVDITTSATPDEIMNLFPRTIPTGIEHGTVTVMMDHIPVEVTTYRTESTYVDFRRPSAVSFTKSLQDDLKRRDFTVNAMALNESDVIIDPFNGQVDLLNKKLRAVGHPRERFLEDPLRMLRGIRFVSKLGFELEASTQVQLYECSSYIKHISKERIKKELEGICFGEHRAEALTLLVNSKLLTHLGLGCFETYQAHDMSELKDVMALYMLVGSLVEDFKGYIKAWPFSKKEKKYIEMYARFCQEPDDLAMIRYTCGDEFMSLLQMLTLFLEQRTISLPPLIIQNRKEMNITSKQLIRELDKEAGPWLSELLSEIERRIVLGELENKEAAIVAFVKGRK